MIKATGAMVVSALVSASVSACASSKDSTASTDSLELENTVEECYCSVRKRQQLKARRRKQSPPSKGSASTDQLTR